MTAGQAPWYSQVPLQELYWRLTLPPDVLGSLDWISRVILLNEDSETFDRVNKAGASGDHEEELVRTLIHEQIHFYQVLLTGYLFEHVNRLRSIVEQCYAEARHSTAKRNDRNTLTEAVRLIDELPSLVSAGSLGVLRRLMAELREAGRDGLSTLDIAEGHATYIEMRYRYGCDSAEFAELLVRHEIPAEYRVAYDVARRRLGDGAAFQLFSLVCCLALCSSHPVMSYGRLLDKLHSLGSQTDAELTAADLIETCCGYRYLGSPLESTSATSTELSSWLSGGVWCYRSALDALRDAAANDGRRYDLYGFFADPLAHLEELASLVYPTVMLNPLPTGGIPLLLGQPKDPESRETHRGLFRAVICRQLMTTADPAADSTDEDMRHAWQTCLTEARAGAISGFYNLGVFAMKRGQERAARVWWRIAALDGDVESIKALAIACSEIGDEDGARNWFDVARSPSASAVEIGAAALLQIGEEIDAADSDAADECFRRAAWQDDVRGAWLYGSRVIDRDPREGLYYLVLAAGAGAAHPEAVEADALIHRLYRTWGRRTSRRYRAEVSERLLREMR